MVSIGYSETKGKMIYAGPSLSASKRINCPPAPNKPTAKPSKIDRLSVSIFQLIKYKAINAQGIIVNDHTI